ncbi:MAG: ATP-binding protein [Lentisphaerae bacterium]|nr:ATP-binding protein [Lentisphaerota bacterium]MCP4265601.1 ATP-binding protein [Candidatus Brocadiaceae bacterium]
MKNATLESMKQMKLRGMASAYEAILGLPINQHPETHEMLAILLDAEQQHRSLKRMELFIRLSKMRYRATLQDINCSQNRNLSKEKLALLADCSYIQRGENILITGATGCGKSYLACALGHQACVQGWRSLYFNMNRLTEQIALAKTDGTLIKWLDRMKRAKLIILDDFGLQPITHAVKLILLQILEDRYERASTMICSQLPIAKWYEYFDEPTLADAILDRIIPKAHRIELKGKSLRKRSEHLL